MKRNRITAIFLVILCMVLFCACNLSVTEEPTSGELKVHFLDVGQADCTLIQNGSDTMLIDGGNNEDESYILSYLEKLNITEIDYAIGTHSHEDHIGSLDSVLNSVKVNNIILPEEEVKSKTYQDVLDSVDKQGVNLIRPVVGDEYQLGDGTFTIIAPSEKTYSDTNDYSIGLLLKYGKSRFLFTGDASEKSEKEMIKTGIDLTADVFQAGHHGAATSNSQELLEKADPVYVVISCGEDNQYGHPHAEPLARFQDMDMQIYRTDKQGTVIAVSDGKNITWEVGKSIAIEENLKDKKKEKAEKAEYILNTNSKKFHLPDCGSVKSIDDNNRKKVKEKRDKLIKEGYEPCKTCNP